MIGRQHRFHGHNSLNFVYKHGKTARDSALSLRYTLNPRRRTFRVAVVVGRKVAKSAVLRNRIRRRIYSAAATHQKHMTEPYDLVFTVFNASVADMAGQSLYELVESLLKKAGILTSDSKSKHDIVKNKES